MKKKVLSILALCSAFTIFFVASCSSGIQRFGSASLSVDLPISASDTLGRALVSSSGNLYLRLIREDSGGGLYGPLYPVNGRVQIADVEPGDYIDILVVHTTIDIVVNDVFGWMEEEFDFSEQYRESYKFYIESSLAAVIDGYGSIGWSGAKTLSPGSNNLGTLTLRPLCKTKNTIKNEENSFSFDIEKGTALSRFYQLDFGEDIEFEDDIQLGVSATEDSTLSFELYNAEGNKNDKENSEFWTIPKGTETLFLLVSGSPGENGARIQVFGPPSFDFGVDLDTDPVISVDANSDTVNTESWTIGPNESGKSYTLSVDGNYKSYEWQINGEKVSGEKTSTFTFKPSDYVNSLRPGTNTITLVVTVANGDKYSAFVEFTLSEADPIQIL